jgi:hypothetical protein
MDMALVAPLPPRTLFDASWIEALVKRLDKALIGEVSPDVEAEFRSAVWYRAMARRLGLSPLRVEKDRDRFDFGAVRQLGELQMGYEVRPEGAVISLVFPDERFLGESALRRRREAEFEALAQSVEQALEGRAAKICRTTFFLYAYVEGGLAAERSGWKALQARHAGMMADVVALALASRFNRRGAGRSRAA